MNKLPALRLKLIYLLYWTAIAATAHLWTHDVLPFSHSVLPFSLQDKILMTSAFWLGSLIFWRAILGVPGLVSGTFGMLFSILTVPAVPISLLMGFVPRLQKLSQRVAWKTSYILAATSALTIAFMAERSGQLVAVKPLLWSLMILGWAYCMSIVLKPETLIDGFKSFLVLFSESNLKGFAPAQQQPVQPGTRLAALRGIWSAVKSHAKVYDWTIALAEKLDGPRSALLVFVAFFASMIATSVVMFAGIYRISHLMAVKGAYSGTGFIGSASNYIYISISEFLGNRPHQIVAITDAVQLPTIVENGSLYFFMSMIVVGIVTVTRRGAQGESSNQWVEVSEHIELIESCLQDLTSKVASSSRVDAVDSRVSKVNENINQISSRVNTGFAAITTKLGTLESSLTSVSHGTKNLNDRIGALNEMRDRLNALRNDVQELREAMPKDPLAPGLAGPGPMPGTSADQARDAG